MKFLIDTRVNCCSVITVIRASEYLKFIEDAYKNRGGIEGQRDPLKTTTAIRIRKRMIEDLKQGAVLPPVVLGVVIADADLALIKSGEIKDILGHLIKLDKEKISIIDGMQRTTALIELARHTDIQDKEIWIEYWLAANINRTYNPNIG